MDLGIGGRVALVTGASSGIGEAVAMALAAEGVKLAVAARRAELLDGIASRAKAAGAADARGFEVDLSSPDSVARLLEATHAAFGDIDILVLNGGGPKPGRFADVTLEDWDAAYRGVLRGMVQLLEATVPAMRARKWGRVVALTSTSVKQPIGNLVLSNAFRTGLGVGLLKTLVGLGVLEGVVERQARAGGAAQVGERLGETPGEGVRLPDERIAERERGDRQLHRDRARGHGEGARSDQSSTATRARRWNHASGAGAEGMRAVQLRVQASRARTKSRPGSRPARRSAIQKLGVESRRIAKSSDLGSGAHACSSFRKSRAMVAFLCGAARLDERVDRDRRRLIAHRRRSDPRRRRRPPPRLHAARPRSPRRSAASS